MLERNLVNTGSRFAHKGKLHVSYYTESGNESSVMAEADLLLFLDIRVLFKNFTE